MNFEERLNADIAEIEEILKKYLPKEEGYAKTVAEAANYSVLAGGKRLRPMLLLECCRLFGGRTELAAPFMAAIEFIHTYSWYTTICPAWTTTNTAGEGRPPMPFTARAWRCWQGTPC